MKRMLLAVVLCLGASVSVTTAFADTFVCATPDGRTVATYQQERIPKNCGPVKVVSDAPTHAPDPFERFGGSVIMHTPFFLSADRARVIGQVRNDSSERIETIFLYFSAYNSEGEKVADPLAVTSNLDPGEVWNVEAYIRGGNASRVSLKDYRINH